MSSLLLEVKDLFCERDDRVLFENLSFQLEQGQVLQLVGKNGSGKTSLLRILTGLYQGFEGRVEYFGDALDEVREHYHSMLLYVGHNVSVKLGLTARENLIWYAKIQPQLDEHLIDIALVNVGLDGFEDVYCQNLSAGQKRRVNLARLYMLPSEKYPQSLWILDEPFTAIDVEGVRNIEQKILCYVAGGGSVILATHQPLHFKEPLTQLNLDRWGT